MAVLQDININVHGQPSEKRLQTFLRLSQNENGRMINFRVLGPPLPSNCTATFSGTKPDGNVYSKTGTVAGNFVVIQEDMQMTAVAGVWDAKLDIINGSHNIMTALIRVVIDADVVDPDAIASDSQLQGLVAEAKYYAEHARTDAYGSPLTAPTKAQMTDHTRVYVYTGSEPNMVAGNWYHWNGTAWISGGVYNSVAVQSDSELNDFSTNPVQNKVIKAALDQIEGAIPEIDATLSVAGKAADGKATGDKIEELKEDLDAGLEVAKAYTDGLIYGAEAANLFDKTLATDGVVLIYTGATSTKDNRFTSDYIPVRSGQLLTYSGSNANMWIAGYNSEKVFADSWQTTEMTYTVPNGVKYVRFSDYLQYKDTAALSTEAQEGIYDIIGTYDDQIDNLSQKVANSEEAVTDIATGYYGKSEVDVSEYVEEKLYRIRNGALQAVEIAGYTAVIMPCQPNEMYFVSSVVAQSDMLYLAIFCDSSMGVVGTYKQGNNSTRSTYTQEAVTIPSDASYAIFTSYNETAKVYVTDYSVILYQSELEKVVPAINSEYLFEFNGQEKDSLLGTYAKLISGTLKWTVLGDSITDTWDGHAQAGGGASDAAHGYAKIVARWLSTKYGSGLTFVNNGTGGITSQGSIEKVAEYLEGQGYDLIVVALGTNDWNLQTALATFATNYNALLDEIETRCPNAEIAMIGLGYFADWKPAKTIREDKYNEVLYNIAKTRNLRFVAPYWEMKNAVVNGGYAFDDITYTPDPVHPNDIGHRIWANTAYKLFDIL